MIKEKVSENHLQYWEIQWKLLIKNEIFLDNKQLIM
jgi:hypothetical protein